jgi:hypothetical protein
MENKINHNQKNLRLYKSFQETDVSKKLKIQEDLDEIKEKNCPNSSIEEILKYFEDKNIIWIETDIDHDGYDYLGPQSDLYDLNFIEYNKELDIYYLYFYHTENWYSSKDEHKYYYLEKKKPYKELSKKILHENYFGYNSKKSLEEFLQNL